jgi:ADP-ribosyl-[dinitrogen reductase] hydrolase
LLVELAVGDAYGAGFEYADAGYVTANNDLSGYVRHPRHSIVPGSYTDDTQMSIAIAEAILSGEEWTPEMLARRFVEAFKRDPREGYAGGFYSFLLNVRDGTHFLQEIGGDSDKSGAAMRSGPIGVFRTVEEVMDKTHLQAAITHNTPSGINAAVAAALMTHYFLYDLGPKRDLGRFLDQHLEGGWSQEWRGKVGSKGWMSVRAAITAVMENSSLSSILKQSVAFTGDVDTVACIAMAAGSCCSEVEQDLPPVLIEQLENGPYGRDYLAKLDQQLMAVKARQGG